MGTIVATFRELWRQSCNLQLIFYNLMLFTAVGWQKKRLQARDNLTTPTPRLFYRLQDVKIIKGIADIPNFQQSRLWNVWYCGNFAAENFSFQAKFPPISITRRPPIICRFSLSLRPQINLWMNDGGLRIKFKTTSKRIKFKIKSRHKGMFCVRLDASFSWKFKL